MYEEALAIDAENKNTKWADTTTLEMLQLKQYSTFIYKGAYATHKIDQSSSRNACCICCCMDLSIVIITVSIAIAITAFAICLLLVPKQFLLLSRE